MDKLNTLLSIDNFLFDLTDSGPPVKTIPLGLIKFISFRVIVFGFTIL